MDRKSGAQERFGRDLESRSAAAKSTGDVSEAILVPRGRFWAPFWPQLGAKGDPKINFWVPCSKKSKKGGTKTTSKNI